MGRHHEETDFREEDILAEYEYNKSTEDKRSIKTNVRAQERGREEAGGGSMRGNMNLRDISVCLQMAITSQRLISLLRSLTL